MNIKIVNYKKEDKEDLRRLIIGLRQFESGIDTWKFYKFDKEYEKKAIEKLLKNVEEKEGKIYLAKFDGKIIGFIAGYIVPDKGNFEIYNWKRGYVDELYIDEKYRTQGIGKKLLEKIEKYFKSKKCDIFGLDIVAANKGAEEFYKKQGLEERSLFLSKALNKKVKK